MKLHLKKWTAAILTMAITVCTVASYPSQVSAAGTQGKYVSDLVLYQGDIGSAKAEYPEYTFLDQNMNEDSGADKESYIGYKTTDDESFAIRDIAALEMNGSYKITDYATMVNDRKDNIKGLVDGLRAAAEEFRVNYEANKPRALRAYDLLNTYYEDDTKLHMGDFFLAREDKVSYENYQTLYMEANSTTMHALQKILLTSTDTAEDDSTWVDRMSDTDGFNGLVEKEHGKTDAKTKKATFKELHQRYGEDIEYYVNSWEELREGLLDYQKLGIPFGTDEADEFLEELTEKEEAGEEIEDGMSSIRYLTYGSIFESLKEAPYEEGSMLDVFLRSLDENEIDEETMLVFMDSMSDGQRELSSSVGLTELLLATTHQQTEVADEESAIPMDDKSIEESEMIQEEQNQEILDNVDELMDIIEENSSDAKDILTKDAVSVYAGVDRDFFHGEIAITGDGEKQQVSSDTPWYATDAAVTASSISIAIGTGLVVAGVLTLASRALIRAGLEAKMAALKPALNQVNRFIELYEKEMSISSKLSEDMIQLIAEEDMVYGRTYLEAVEKRSSIVKRMNSAESSMPGRVSKIVGGVFIAVGLALTTYFLVQEISMLLHDEKHVTYLAIPDKMVDFAENAGDDSPFLYYRAVQNQEGNAADLNGFTSDKWLALYTTRSYAAGDPILAKGFGTIFKGSVGTDVNKQYIHQFTAKEPQNLQEFSVNGADATKMYFSFQSAAQSNAASVFGGADSTVAIAILVAALIACAGVFMISGKKKEKMAA